MKKILIVNNDDSFVFNIVQLLRESALKPEFDVVHNNEIDFDKVNSYSGVLVSPGPGIPSEAGDTLKLIELCKNTHSMLGICLGHQALAESFGAKLIQLPAPLHGHRTILNVVDNSGPLCSHLKGEVSVGRYHSWAVDPKTMPEELKISSIDEEGNVMSFYHSRLPIFGLQFHPESYMSNCGETFMGAWLDVVNKHAI